MEKRHFGSSRRKISCLEEVAWQVHHVPKYVSESIGQSMQHCHVESNSKEMLGWTLPTNSASSLSRICAQVCVATHWTINATLLRWQRAWLAISVWYNYQLHHLHCRTIDKYKDNWAQSCLSQSIKVGSFVNWRIQIIENNNVFCSFLGSLLPNGPLQAMPWTASDIIMQFTTIGSWHLDKPWFTGRNNNTNNNHAIPNND